jgi:hypothetical protein
VCVYALAIVKERINGKYLRKERKKERKKLPSKRVQVENKRNKNRKQEERRKKGDALEINEHK